VAGRRQHERYDVVGAMWGMLELNAPVQIRNVSTTGALLDSPVPMALDSTQAMHVLVDGEAVRVDALVRHVTSAHGDASRPRYLVGIEFSSPPVSVVQSIEQLGLEHAE
jgi:hypothetical protein